MDALIINLNMKDGKTFGDNMISDKVTPWYVLNSPEIGQPFQDFHDAVAKGGVLDKKTRELLMLSLASAFRCPNCTESHIKAALEAGVTKEEITEALLITAVEAAGTQLTGQGKYISSIWVIRTNSESIRKTGRKGEEIRLFALFLVCIMTHKGVASFL